jgi:hypothetical protein
MTRALVLTAIGAYLAGAVSAAALYEVDCYDDYREGAEFHVHKWGAAMPSAREMHGYCVSETVHTFLGRDIGHYVYETIGPDYP